jgi:hypothetical protein
LRRWRTCLRSRRRWNGFWRPTVVVRRWERTRDAAMWAVAALTCASGFVSAFRMTETLRCTGEDNIT